MFFKKCITFYPPLTIGETSSYVFLNIYIFQKADYITPSSYFGKTLLGKHHIYVFVKMYYIRTLYFPSQCSFVRKTQKIYMYYEVWSTHLNHIRLLYSQLELIPEKWKFKRRLLSLSDHVPRTIVCKYLNGLNGRTNYYYPHHCGKLPHKHFDT